jgi:glycosyltransferase involved in cell wall biosynthesis
MRVCLVLEGSYPLEMGAVSEWVHHLIQGLPEVEFVLWTISPAGDEASKYAFPANVSAWHRVGLDKEIPSDLPVRGERLEAWNEVTRFHLEMLEQRYGRFEQVQALVSGPKRRLNLFHVVRDEQSWRLISFFHKSSDAVHPFAEYYGGWYATHLPLLKLLEEPIPEADLYHALSTGYAGLLAAVAKLRTRRPMLLTELGVYVKEREREIYGGDAVTGSQRQMWSNVLRGLARIAYDQADLIISPCERSRNLQLSLGAAGEKTRIIPNGIQVDKFNGLRPGDRQPIPHIGFVGRVVPDKDVRTFIRAGRIIKDAFPSAEFSVIGPMDEDPGYSSQCQELAASLGLSDCMRFLGRQDVLEYYPQLDLVLLTSIKETQPRVLMEAMCAGIPVVSTDVGDARDLLYPEWPVVPPKDPESLARAAIQILSHPEQARQLSETARQRVVQRYDIRKLTEQYAVLYRSLAGEKGRS